MLITFGFFHSNPIISSIVKNKPFTTAHATQLQTYGGLLVGLWIGAVCFLYWTAYVIEFVKTIYTRRPTNIKMNNTE